MEWLKMKLLKMKWPNRRTVLLVAIAGSVLMCLFPPWHAMTPQGSFSFGYDFLFMPPHPLAEVNFGRLFVQILVIAGIAFGVIQFKKGAALD